MTTKESKLGDAGEEFACDLLRGRGWSVRRLGRTKLIDIEAQKNGKTVYVSVKSSESKQHARLGSISIVKQFRDEHVYMIFVPKLGAEKIQFKSGGYELLIVPGKIAREDGLHVTNTYLATPKRDGTPKKTTGSVFVKGYSTRPVQREAWARWVSFRERWDVIEGN